MGKIIAVNISEKKGTQKKNVHRAKLIEEFGIENDAHAGKWHRQVSLLSYEKIEEFKAKGAPIVLCQEKVFLQECFMEESLKRGMRFI